MNAIKITLNHDKIKKHSMINESELSTDAYRKVLFEEIFLKSLQIRRSDFDRVQKNWR